jgi:anti-sigma factor RsiW
MRNGSFKSCPTETGKLRELLLEYPAGRLEPAASEYLEKHLAECPACRETVEAQTAVWNALDTWEPEAPALDFNRRLWHEIDRVAAEPWYRSLVEWRPLLPAMFAAMLVLGAGLLITRSHDSLLQSVAPNDGVTTTEVDQAVTTLDDLQLLQQLDSVVRPESDAASEI